jgi:large subunit ribosomal protein L15
MLNRLSPKAGSRRPRRRIGRGVGSGLGKTSGRGQKGAGSRTGYRTRTWNEGGQMPLSRRLPIRGFNNPFRVEYQVVNVSELVRFAVGSDVDAAALVKAGLIHTVRRPVKILGDGDLAGALRLRVDRVSAKARHKIEAAGGSVELVTRAKRSEKASV